MTQHSLPALCKSDKGPEQEEAPGASRRPRACGLFLLSPKPSKPRRTKKKQDLSHFLRRSAPFQPPPQPAHERLDLLDAGQAGEPQVGEAVRPQHQGGLEDGME